MDDNDPTNGGAKICNGNKGDNIYDVITINDRNKIPRIDNRQRR